jgi:excisionase family DNA binding protein
MKEKTPGAPAPTSADALVKQIDASTFLGVSRTTIYFLRKNGTLPDVKIGRAVRFRLADLQKIAASGAATRGAK